MLNLRTVSIPSAGRLQYSPVPERQAARHIRSFHFLPLLSPFGLRAGSLQRNRTLQALRDPRPLQYLTVLPNAREVRPTRQT